ncbi:nucleotide sugar dehydrogenase [Mycobacterium sp. 141]|uniref:nucleotide sugar dehydrogenase n=1 Tax=Mycobacterium sp. 141 TaxID=1120797 RepID=UPI0003648DBC|nr:nucleotide sugar dehydrogenase [Mycobacterium sp. 141]
MLKAAHTARGLADGVATKQSISVFGLGYVGCVSAACLAARGHTVVGVDVSHTKLDFLRDGKSPVVEDRIGELVADVVQAGRLTVTTDAAQAVSVSDISIVCVGTPSAASGGLLTRFLENVSEEIGTALMHKDGWHVIVFRSTMVPGTCEQLLIPILERTSGKRVGVDFGVCVNPEFLREGTSVTDFENPPKTVVGESDARSGSEVMDLYDGLPGPRFRVPISVAEMTKYVDNSFHALKVTFGNEIGALCARLGLDSHTVMDIFLSDTKLNISPAYLRPGFAFGGSCLPKDVRALTHTARQNDLELPVLSNVLVSNEAQLRRTVDKIIELGRRKVTILGLAFKSGTDDLRESPMVELAERLIGKGYDVKVYDANVALSQLIGANREYLDTHLPHVGQLVTADLSQALDHGELLVVGATEPGLGEAIDALDGDRVVIDLVRLPDAETRRAKPGYIGIGW